MKPILKYTIGVLIEAVIKVLEKLINKKRPIKPEKTKA